MSDIRQTWSKPSPASCFDCLSTTAHPTPVQQIGCDTRPAGSTPCIPVCLYSGEQCCGFKATALAVDCARVAACCSWGGRNKLHVLSSRKSVC